MAVCGITVCTNVYGEPEAPTYLASGSSGDRLQCAEGNHVRAGGCSCKSIPSTCSIDQGQVWSISTLLAAIRQHPRFVQKRWSSPEHKQIGYYVGGQLTNKKFKNVHRILSKLPIDDHEKQVCKNYALRDGRITRLTLRGMQWVVPRGMWRDVVRASHDDMGHFAVEKTLQRLCKYYRFPRMRQHSVLHPLPVQQETFRQKGRDTLPNTEDFCAFTYP